MRRASVTLIIFAKAPVAGRVKTRLARRYGHRGAAAIYRNLLRRTVASAVATGASTELWAAPHRHPFLVSLAARHRIPLRVQPPGDLGRRMDRTLRMALRTAPGACIVGGDCAAFSVSGLSVAIDALGGDVDAVFVPALDGGYTLVGLRRPLPGLFQAVPWGSSEVMRVTRRRLRADGVRWAEGPVSYDIDRPADLKRIGRAGAGQYPRAIWKHTGQEVSEFSCRATGGTRSVWGGDIRTDS